MEYLLEEGAELREWVLESNPALAEGFGVIDPWGSAIAVPQHFKTKKNEEGKHGTGDQTITEEGDGEACRSAQNVGRIALSRTCLLGKDRTLPLYIYSSEDPRCLNSADRFVHYLQRFRSERVSVLPIQVLPGLNRMGLGDLDGLTDEQIAQRDPNFARETGLWMHRMRKRPPFPGLEHGAEDPHAFWKRIYEAAGVIVQACDGIAVPFASFSARTALVARYSMRGPEDLGPDGLPVDIPFHRGDRDKVDLFSINDQGYIQPDEGYFYVQRPTYQQQLFH